MSSSMPQQKSFSVDELNQLHLSRALTESELKRQLSHDLANDPSLATVFNPPQIFSDTETAHGPSNINGIPGAAGLGSTVVVHWTNNDLIRNGHWSNNGSNLYAGSNGNGISPNGGAPTIGGTPNGAAGAGDVNHSSGSGSQRGSQSALLSVKKERHKWPKGKDFLFSTWAFVIGAHTLWELPVLTMRFGGVVFILIYLIMFLLLGTPMLLLEMTMGQYSALSPTKLYRNLCPVFTGVGFAICVSCMFQSIVDMSVITWSAQAFYLLFTGQVFTENFFYGQVLDWEDGSGLDNLGTLHGQLSLCLGIACLVIFILIAAGTRSIGKVSMILVPICYGLLMTLTIRGCMEEGGPEGILLLLKADWTHITSPRAWIEAAKFVFISMQLGLGVVSTFASFNKYHHNIIRDAGVIAIGHFVWAILAVLFVFSLIGVAHSSQTINIENLKDSDMATAITGKGFWLIGVTLAESAITRMDYNWLWTGLLFCLMVLTTCSTIMGCMEVLSSCVVDEWPSMKNYKPAITFTFLAFIFMINLVMATQGGIYIYYLLTSYYTVWPLIFFGLLTCLGAVFSHGGKYLMKDLSDMSKMPLTHYINSHLSVLFITVIPIFLTVTLGCTLKGIHDDYISPPLKNFKMTLPQDWGMPLGWSLSFIPILIIIGGLLFHFTWKKRGIPFRMHFKRSFKPTDLWYENEHRELMLVDANKDSPILAFRRGGAYANRSSTEV